MNDVIFPVQCGRCEYIHHVTHRALSYAMPRCPRCQTSIDERPELWGGSTIGVSS